MRGFTLFILLALGASLPLAAQAQEYVLTLKDHQFTPREITIPAGEKIRLTVRNLDPTAAEFESNDLNREKVVVAKGEVGIFIGPLNPGRYEFFNDFHRETTGTLIAK